MQRVAQRGVVDPQVTTQRVDPQTLGDSYKVKGLLDLVEEGYDIARIARIALRNAIGKDKGVYA